MIVRDGITRLIERIYAPEADETAWLEGICDGANEAFTGHIACQAFTVHVSQAGVAKFGSFGGDARVNAAMVEAHEMVTDPDDIRRLYFSGPLASAARVLATSKDPALRAQHQRHMLLRSGIDNVGAVGMNSDGRACALGFVHASQKLPSHTRASLARIAGQLASAYRLRRSVEAPAALVSPEGEVLETHTPEAAEATTSLRRAALAMDRAKRQEKYDADAALGYWKAMVEGQWSLVERFESDGRRILVAHPNEPKTRAHHALTENERKVVSRIVLCRPAKLVAYELGFSESAVSEHLSNALRKLGLKNRAELIELHGAIVADTN